MQVPPRPGVIIRAPTREKSAAKTMDSSVGSGITQEVADRVSASSRESASFVVYTNTGVCPYSDDLVSVAHKKGLIFNKIDVSQRSPPSWLPGTPSIVHEGNVYCGDAAFLFVQHYSAPQTSSEVADSDSSGPNDFMKGSVKSDSTGCGISAAFAPPKQICVDESKFNTSTDDMMQKLLAGRR